MHSRSRIHTPGTPRVLLTVNDDILNGLPLALPAGPLVLLPQLGQHEGACARDDARQGRVARVQQPPRVRRVVEVDAALEDGELRDAEVAADGRHGGR